MNDLSSKKREKEQMIKSKASKSISASQKPKLQVTFTSEMSEIALLKWLRQQPQRPQYIYTYQRQRCKRLSQTIPVFLWTVSHHSHQAISQCIIFQELAHIRTDLANSLGLAENIQCSCGQWRNGPGSSGTNTNQDITCHCLPNTVLSALKDSQVFILKDNMKKKKLKKSFPSRHQENARKTENH